LKIEQSHIDALSETDKVHKFGVLATKMGEDIHLSTIRYALTPSMDVALIFRSGTQKNSNLADSNTAYFQVDNRSSGAEPQDAMTFLRSTFIGGIETLEAGSEEFEATKKIYLDKIPEAEGFFKAPDILLCVLRADKIVYSLGVGKPTEILEKA